MVGDLADAGRLAPVRLPARPHLRGTGVGLCEEDDQGAEAETGDERETDVDHREPPAVGARRRRVVDLDDRLRLGEPLRALGLDGRRLVHALGHPAVSSGAAVGGRRRPAEIEKKGGGQELSSA